MIGDDIYSLVAELYPICRSITGDGVRQTLRILRRHVPLEIYEVPSGTQVFDWHVPQEWNIRDAYIADPAGRRIVELRRHNLHVWSYSSPVRTKMRLAELRPRLHTLPDRPDWIPYRTSYYNAAWGFCLSQRQLESLREDEEYEVVVDSTLGPGSLTYGELYLPGRSQSEILFSAHVCHPSLANDNLSGIAVLIFLAAELARRNDRRHSLRFLFIPGTIGSITWLARNQDKVGRIRHGLVVSCVGDAGAFHYKRSRRGGETIDRVVGEVLADRGAPHEVVDFSPYGYDERQFGSPGFDLPVGLFMRGMYGRFPEYHTSADDLDFVKPAALAESLETLLGVVDRLDRERTLVNTNPNCEPQLGRRGLYGRVGGHRSPRDFELAMLWVLNQSDGRHSLGDIARRSGLSPGLISEAADTLAGAGLLRDTDPEPGESWKSHQESTSPATSH
jgi:aminopeptidase-like protein